MAAMIIEKKVKEACGQKGISVRMSFLRSIYPDERLSIMLELSGDLSREDVSSVRDILSECQHGVTRNELDFYKQYLKNACTLQMKEAEYWMHVVPLRHLEGKDFTTGFSAKIDAVTVDVLERVFMALSEGAGIEYVTIKK
jgi:hypothetical protein